jgi:hypothetical protein
MPQYIGGTPAAYLDRYRIVFPLHAIGPKAPLTITFSRRMTRWWDFLTDLDRVSYSMHNKSILFDNQQWTLAVDSMEKGRAGFEAQHVEQLTGQ